MLSTQSHYREILKQELESRTRNNRHYSLRAFSRDLGMPSAQLSDVLNGKYGISESKAQALAKKLGYSSRDTELFCTLVEKEHARSKTKRESAALRLKKYEQNGIPGSYDTLESDVFEAIAGWFHFPIIELTRVEGFQNNAEWIGNHLGISTIEADQAVARLKRLGLLKEKSAKLIPSNDFYGTKSSIPSEARRQFHLHLLRKANEALDLQPASKRDFSATILAMDASQIDQVRELSEEFRLKVDHLMQKSPKKDSVYCLSVQFFELGGRMK